MILLTLTVIEHSSFLSFFRLLLYCCVSSNYILDLSDVVFHHFEDSILQSGGRRWAA